MIAARALFFGTCRQSRWYLAAGNVRVRAAPAAASPGAAQMQGLPRPAAFFPFRFPADSVTRGASLAQEHRCPAAGKAPVSVPVCAIRSRAVVTPNPGMPSSWAIWCWQGSQRAAIRSSRTAICAV